MSIEYHEDIHERMENIVEESCARSDHLHKDGLMRINQEVITLLDSDDPQMRQKVRIESIRLFLDYKVETDLFADLIMQCMDDILSHITEKNKDLENPFSSFIAQCTDIVELSYFGELKSNFDKIKAKADEKYDFLKNEIEYIREELLTMLKNELPVYDLMWKLEELRQKFYSYCKEDFLKLFYPELPVAWFRKKYKKSLSAYRDNFSKEYDFMLFLVGNLKKDIKNFSKNKKQQEEIEKKRQEHLDRKAYEKKLKEMSENHNETPKQSSLPKEEKKKPSKNEQKMKKMQIRLDNLQEKVDSGVDLTESQQKELEKMLDFLQLHQKEPKTWEIHSIIKKRIDDLLLIHKKS